MRITMVEVYLQFAEILSHRSTCERAGVGVVITDEAMLQVLGVGYNGNARSLPNLCDDPNAIGNCGCIHAEINALLKAPGAIANKKMFTTTSPCLMCAKAIINSNVSSVYFREFYRDQDGLRLLARASVFFEHVPTIRREST